MRFEKKDIFYYCELMLKLFFSAVGLFSPFLLAMLLGPSATGGLFCMSTSSTLSHYSLIWVCVDLQNVNEQTDKRSPGNIRRAFV